MTLHDLCNIQQLYRVEWVDFEICLIMLYFLRSNIIHSIRRYIVIELFT